MYFFWFFFLFPFFCCWFQLCFHVDKTFLWVLYQDIEYLRLYASRYGRDEGLALLEKTGLYLGPERYTLEHMPIDVMRGEIFNACRS